MLQIFCLLCKWILSSLVKMKKFNGGEFEQTLGDSEGQESLAGCSPWGCKESHTTWQLNSKRREADLITNTMKEMENCAEKHFCHVTNQQMSEVQNLEVPFCSFDRGYLSSCHSNLFTPWHLMVTFLPKGTVPHRFL